MVGKVGGRSRFGLGTPLIRREIIEGLLRHKLSTCDRSYWFVWSDSGTGSARIEFRLATLVCSNRLRSGCSVSGGKEIFTPFVSDHDQTSS